MFLDLITDDAFSWECHIYPVMSDEFRMFRNNMNKMCDVTDDLRMIFFSYIHFIITYGVIF